MTPPRRRRRPVADTTPDRTMSPGNRRRAAGRDSVCDGLDDLLQGARLTGTTRGPRALVDHLRADLLELLAAQSLADLGEPLVLLLRHVVLDVLDEHGRLGVEALVARLHRGELHHQDVGDVMLL